MDYKEAINYMYSRLPMFSRVGAAAYKPGLETSVSLAKHFGDPQNKLKAIHVAGTNGKGSVSNMLSAVLQANGYKTALYTSPHLVDFRERMRINGEMIPKEKVVKFVEQFKASKYPGYPSFFELTMMMAFVWFADEEVDYAVIETGMGGRLDSTNIITPLSCIITNISFDHTQFLGDTLSQIAFEKAGIIKNGIPVTIGQADGDVKNIFINKAGDENAPILFASEENVVRSITESEYGWNCDSVDFGLISLPLAGDYQKHNIKTLLTALRQIREIGIQIESEKVCYGLCNLSKLTHFRGRWTIVNREPFTVCDTGHNVEGLVYNLAQLQRMIDQHKDGGRIIFVIGFVADKDVSSILPMFPKNAEYIFTNADIPRALKAEELVSLAENAGLKGVAIVPVNEAYRYATSLATHDDIIYIGGSTFVVADFFSEYFRNE